MNIGCLFRLCFSLKIMYYRRFMLFRVLAKAALSLLCVYLAIKIGDYVLSTLFSTILPLRNGDDLMLPTATCPPHLSPFQQQQQQQSEIVPSTKKHEKILKGPSQFAAEDSNLPYIIESYRTSALSAKIVKLLTHPVDAPCRNLVRFGLTEPGGHDGHLVCIDVMPSDEGDSKCLVYSFGVGYDFSFEDQIIKRKCEVHSFDPSMIFMDHVRGEGVNFHRLGIADHDSDDYAPFLGGYIKEPQIWRVRTLESILDSLGHQKNNITILKVDIEGGEWALIEWLMFERPQLLARINQLIVEFHIGHRQQRQIDAIYKIAALFRKCSGFQLVYADYWRRDSNMHAFLATFVNSKLALQTSF